MISLPAAAALARFGRIDILVNNAAVRDEKAIDAMTIADWRATLLRVADFRRAVMECDAIAPDAVPEPNPDL